MHRGRQKGFTLIEFLILAVFVAILASFAAPFSRSVPGSARMTKQVNNVKQITLACLLYASDNAGMFPDGNYDPNPFLMFSESPPAKSAEGCFDDLIESGMLEVEKVYWSPGHTIQCASSTPDEDGTLEPGENCWDYIAGLGNDSEASLPVVFEASDRGEGAAWTEKGGHPWEGHVIVGFVDGSASKENLDNDGQFKVHRGGTEVDICVPTPGANDWPERVVIAPATPAP